MTFTFVLKINSKQPINIGESLFFMDFIFVCFSLGLTLLEYGPWWNYNESPHLVTQKSISNVCLIRDHLQETEVPLLRDSANVKA